MTFLLICVSIIHEFACENDSELKIAESEEKEKLFPLLLAFIAERDQDFIIATSSLEYFKDFNCGLYRVKKLIAPWEKIFSR